MDPLTAIGLASNILSFIDFSAKLIKGAYKIYSSQSGTTEENEDSSKLLDDLREATEALYSDFRGQTKHEKSLRKLSENCRQLSAELQTVLNKLRVTEKDSRLKSVVVSLMSMRKEKEIASIEKRLDSYRLEILLWLDMMNGLVEYVYIVCTVFRLNKCTVNNKGRLDLNWTLFRKKGNASSTRAHISSLIFEKSCIGIYNWSWSN
jgi:uncharacterized protein YukE